MPGVHKHWMTQNPDPLVGARGVGHLLCSPQPARASEEMHLQRVIGAALSCRLQQV